MLGLVAGAVGFPLGLREFYSLICLILCVFVTATIFMEFFRGARVIRARSGASFLASAVDLTMRNTRRYGGYIVHMGMVLIFIGLAGAAFNQRRAERNAAGFDACRSGRILCCCRTSTPSQRRITPRSGWSSKFRSNNKPVMMLYPERRIFPANQQSGTMVAIYSTLKHDLYVVYAGQSPGRLRRR